jgi:hypothetical protein
MGPFGRFERLIMKDWAVSFVAAVLLVGLIIWCARVFIGMMYG